MNKIKYFIPSIIVMSIIFTASHDPASGEKSDFITNLLNKVIYQISNYKLSVEDKINISFFVRKLAHMTEYFILNLSYYYSFNSISENKKRNILICFLLTVFYACTDEYHQTFIEGRVGTIKDVFIDSTGALIASILFIIM
jgi:VanZ family protein